MLNRGSGVGVTKNSITMARIVLIASPRILGPRVDIILATKLLTTSDAPDTRVSGGNDRSNMRVTSVEKRPRGSVPTTVPDTEPPVASSPAAVSGSISTSPFVQDVDLSVVAAALELYAVTKTGKSASSLLKGEPALGPADMAIMRLLYPSSRAGKSARQPLEKSIVGVGPDGAFVRTEAGTVTRISGDPPEVAAGTILAQVPGESK